MKLKHSWFEIPHNNVYMNTILFKNVTHNLSFKERFLNSKVEETQGWTPKHTLIVEFVRIIGELLGVGLDLMNWAFAIERICEIMSEFAFWEAKFHVKAELCEEKMT